MTASVTKVSKKLLARTKRVREDLHRHPELSMQEHRTCALVADRLRRIGLDEVQEGVAGTGVVGLLRGGLPGAVVALRADMDALPIQEETGLPWASRTPGVMHACGHDGHVAVLLAAAEVLTGMRERVPGSVKFIFQPGEEGAAGGRQMMEAGCLKEPDVDAIFALHGTGRFRPGQIGVSLTPCAASQSFRIEIVGDGGHGAYPHTVIDPVAIGAQIVTSAQSVVSRESRPDEPLVLSFCSFQAGTKSNIIPDTAVLLGTIRAMESSTARRARKALGRLARGVAKAMRARVVITDEEGYPPVKNDPALVELVRRVGASLLGKRNVFGAPEQTMGAEDFAFFLPEQGGVPGVMFRLGVDACANAHTSGFDFGSAALETGILMMTNVALAYLEGRAQSR